MTLDMSASAVADSIAFFPEDELRAYRTMLLIRRFEEKVGQLYALQAFHGPCPLSIGTEGVITGMMMAAEQKDPVVTAVRTHGPMLARGVAPDQIMAELLGRDTGLSRGKGGTINMYTRAHNFYSGHSLPGLSASIGTGLAFASRYRKSDAVCLCFFGDGAASRGRVLESYRIAAEWRLPIVFVIDNNAAAQGSSIALGSVPSALAAGGMRFAIPGEQVDGIDVRRVRAAGQRALARARRSEGPTILEMLTYRYRGHGGVPAEPGRSERRRDEADPVAKARARILDSAVASEAELRAVEKEVRETVTAAAAAAKTAPRPDTDALTSGTLA